MKGSVEKTILHQRLEIKFFYDSTLLAPWAKKELVKYKSFLIKETQFYKK